MARLFSQSMNRDNSLRTCIFYFLLDVVLLTLIGVMCYFLFIGIIPPYKRGFYCNDDSIRFAFKPNTVSVTVLLTVAIAVPFFIVELFEYSIIRRTRSNSKLHHAPKMSSTFNPTKLFLQVTTSLHMEFMFGLVIEIALMHFAKSLFGVLRPHFIDVCRPNFSAIDCSKDNGFVYEPKCTALPDHHSKVKVARESFPSGHSSTACYSFCFILFYLMNRRTHASDSFRRLATLLIPIYLCWVLFVLVTRVTDHWHHVSDVVGGVTLGAGVAMIMFLRKDSALFRKYDTF